MPSQRKGRKSRKSAKQKKAYQARKYREACQARRDHKLRRAFEAVCIASANTSFYRFPDLPFELREMVWDQCIPSRLVFHDLDVSDHYDVKILHGQRRPPIISKVCHEARTVALRHGSRITLGTWHINRESGGRIRPRRSGFHEKTWFDTRRDIILICERRADLSSPWLNVSGETLAAIRNSARLGSLRMFPSLLLRDQSNMVVYKFPHEANVAYVAKKYHLRAPLFAVVKSGLFGLFGENKVIAVDLDDTAKFRALKKIRLHGGHGETHESRDLHEKGYDDIDLVPEIDRGQMPEHGRARWLFEKFCSGMDEFKQFLTGNPEVRLLALVFLYLDVRGAAS